MHLVSAGQTRRRQGLLSLFLGLGVVPFVVAFFFGGGVENLRQGGGIWLVLFFFLFNLNQSWFGNGLDC